jgi:hypothetical protein
MGSVALAMGYLALNQTRPSYTYSPSGAPRDRDTGGEMVLPRFMVPDETQVVVPEATVRAAVEAMFAAVGMPADAAAECAAGQPSDLV